MTSYKLNQFLIIDFYENNTILLNILNSNRKFKYKWNAELFVNLIKVARIWWTKKELLSELENTIDWNIISEQLDLFIQIWALISEEKYNSFKKEISIWLKYKWITALIYHIWSSNPNYIEPKNNNWVEDRHNTHRAYLENDWMINIYKKCKSLSEHKISKIIWLPEINFLELLKTRKTVRNFNNEVIDFKLLYSVLYYSLFTVRETREMITNYKEDINNLKKSEYSAFEFYIVVFNVEWLEKWVYHYNLQNLTLDFIKKWDFRSKVKEIQMWQAVLDDAKYAMYITADYSRQMWRYRYSHKLRLVLVQVWKIAQQVINISLAYDIWTFMSPAIKDSKAEELLWLNPKTEWSVYFMCFWKYYKDKSNSYYFNNLPKITKDDKKVK